MGISIRAYARHRGVSDAAVRKAIKTGRITPEPDGTVDPAKADAQWSRNTDTAQQRQQRPAPQEATPTVRETGSEAPLTSEFGSGGKKLPGVSSYFAPTTARKVMGQQVLTLGWSSDSGFVPVASKRFISNVKTQGLPPPST